MTFAIALLIAQAAATVEPLPIESFPVDAQMAVYERAVPELRQWVAQIEEQIGKVGPPQPGWDESGVTAEQALAAAGGDPADLVLGEWDIGGHGIVTVGDRPLAIPQGFRRYSVRDDDGPVDYHAYHRPSPGVVIHYSGTQRAIGQARCQRPTRIEVISRTAWQDWPEEVALPIFSLARQARDDTRTYCMIWRPEGTRRFAQLDFTPNGEPYSNLGEPQIFRVTPRAEAIGRMFD
jgi:hypothetical protein